MNSFNNLKNMINENKTDLMYHCINLQDHMDSFIEYDKQEIEYKTLLDTKDEEDKDYLDLKMKRLEILGKSLFEYRIILGHLKEMKEKIINLYHCLGMIPLITDLPLNLREEEEYLILKRLSVLCNLYDIDKEENDGEFQQDYLNVLEFVNYLVLMIMDLY